ncbi:MAG: ATP-binding protein [Candidatus Melainabacteria bacterium]|nr:MAG: ATP-binding protein [Candidatus Melainabacteria bacterium]
MARINKLSKDLINKIAAGEVIERPASVVKELLENSIDANSTKVEIRISNDCRNIRIADNGVGIHPDDIDIAFLNIQQAKYPNMMICGTSPLLGFVVKPCQVLCLFQN